MFRFVSKDRFPFCVSAATGLFSFSVGLMNTFYFFFFIILYFRQCCSIGKVKWYDCIPTKSRYG